MNDELSQTILLFKPNKTAADVTLKERERERHLMKELAEENKQPPTKEEERTAPSIYSVLYLTLSLISGA